MPEDASKNAADAAWELLKKKNPKNSKSFVDVWSKINGTTDITPKKTIQRTAGARLETPKKCSTVGEDGPSKLEGNLSIKSECSPSDVLASFDGKDVFALGNFMQRDINGLTDTCSRTRYKALQRVHAVLSADENLISRDLLLDSVCTLFVKPVLRRLEDSTEKCRELALVSLLHIVHKLSDVVQQLLPYTIPVLRERIALKPDTLRKDKPHACIPDPVEPSEEVRVKLVKLLLALISATEEGIAPYAADVAEMFKACARDPAPEVLQVSCECAQTMAQWLSRRMQPVAHEMVKTFTPVFENKRSKVRVAVLKAIGAIMHCGAHETILDLSGFRHPNIVKIEAFYSGDSKVNWFGKFSLDPHPAVREQWVRTAGDWCINLWERLDHETRMIPYVLSGISDEVPSVQEAALEIMIKIGKQYETEKREDLKDTLYYNPEDLNLPSGEYIGGPLAYLPAPFKERAGLGAREVTMGHMKALLYPIIKELTVWTEESRARTARLLRTCLVFSEVQIARNTHRLVPAFVKVVNDPVIRQEIEQCCRIVGRFVEVDIYMEQLLSLTNVEESSENCTNALTVLRHLAYGSAMGAMGAYLGDILDTLTTSDVMRTQNAALKLAAVDLLDVLLTVCEEDCARRTRDVVLLLAHFNTPVPVPLPQVQSRVRQVLRRLAQPVGLSAEELLAAYRGTLFNQLAGRARAWGGFETALLQSVTRDVGAHPSPEDVRSLIALVAGVMPHLAHRAAARVLSALSCVAMTTTPLEDEVAQQVMDVLFDRLSIDSLCDQTVAANTSEAASSQHDQFPALEAVRSLWEGALIPPKVLELGFQRSWLAQLLECMQTPGNEHLRMKSCNVLGSLFDAYDIGAILSKDGDQDLMLCTAVLSRIEDSVHDIRLKALGIAKAVATAFVDRLPVQSVIYKACSQMHLNDDPSRDFQEALSEVRIALGSSSDQGLAAQPDQTSHCTSPAHQICHTVECLDLLEDMD